MDQIVGAIESGAATAQDFAALPVPDHYRGCVVLKSDVEMFAGMDTAAKDPAKSMQLREVPTPELEPGEALIAVMAGSINYNTVWSAIFEPVPTFAFLERYGRTGAAGARHDQPYHVLGSDLSGVVLRTGPGVSRWRPGDRVVAHCLSVELEGPEGHDDTMLDPGQRIWGYETNFGGLAELALVKATQLMPKPAHLTWEEAACSGLVNSTAYRQLVSPNGARLTQGDVVLVWGAAGGLGSYATQLALNGGATPVCVVSSPEKAAMARSMGAEMVIDRAAEGFRFWQDDETQDPKQWRRFGARIRELTGGDDPDIVFEHPGRDTFGASVYVARRGGTVVTCASTSGYLHQYDNRYLWMHLKRIVGSHFANYREAWAANKLISQGVVHPTLSAVFPLTGAGDATGAVHRNAHSGKVGVLCLASQEGLGVTDPELRERHLPAINRFRTPAAVPRPVRPIQVRGKADTAATALVYAYLNRAVSLLEAGYATATDIDTAMRLGCGLPAGPFATLAELGPAAARDTLAKLHADTNDPAYRPAALLTEFAQSGLDTWFEDPAQREPKSGVARPVDRVGVLGTGTMACGVAELLVTAGIPTVVVGREAGRATAAAARVAESLSRSVAKGRMSDRQRADAVALLGSSGDRAALHEVDLVLEAVVEDVPVKRAVFARLGRICKPGAVLATATSSLAVTELAAASGRPSDVIGMHFFNPAPAMRLVEIGSTPATAADVRATARALCTRLGKTGVECADRTGFIVNYLLFAYLNRAIALLADGADVTELDDAVRAGFGYPLGPFALLDVIGLDVSLAILRRLHRTFPEPDFLAAPRLQQLVAAGRLGRKSGGGFHPSR